MSEVGFLILIHVLSAIIGVGPTFFGHVLYRKNQTFQELKSSMGLGKHLEKFPKIGGTIAVLTGILLICLGNYGTFMQLWQAGSLAIYVCIQVTVIAFGAPVGKKLAQWVFNPENAHLVELPAEQKAWLAKLSNIFYIASSLGVLLFIFMILKP